MYSFEVRWFSSVASTNDVCMQIAADGGREGIVVAAHFQQKGRGQRGNIWNSEQSKNLTFSILLRPSFLLVEDQFLISEIAAIALCEFVSYSITGAKVHIKWPNDIYIDDSKVSGVLIENSFSSATLDLSVIGIGLNMNQQKFPAHLPNPTSLALQAGREFNLNSSLEHFLQIFGRWYGLLQQGERNEINSRYLSLLYRIGEFHPYISGATQFQAKIIGVSKIGELVLQTPEGVNRTFAFKEISFVI